MEAPSAPPQITVDSDGVMEETEYEEDVALPTDDHLMTLKALTEKLRLETRRPSYLEWKAQLEGESFRDSGIRKGPIQVEPEGKRIKLEETVVKSDVIQCKLPSSVLKGFRNIDEALNWLRRELVRHFKVVTFIMLHLKARKQKTYCYLAKLNNVHLLARRNFRSVSEIN